MCASTRRVSAAPCAGTAYPTPYLSAGSDTPFWYSVNAGGAHIIMVSTLVSGLRGVDCSIISECTGLDKM